MAPSRDSPWFIFVALVAISLFATRRIIVAATDVRHAYGFDRSWALASCAGGFIFRVLVAVRADE
jgi:hypothetical protein